uniref:Uncharacterized protein n=1 Tax=Ralstonia solanacearum TaxID=305 RepID=A0A0S4TRZ9_RALSL|nr:exported protein of unknown function [Ralstonia solanacearum]
MAEGATALSPAASSGGASHALVHQFLSGKVPGLLTFGVSGGFEAGARIQGALNLFTRHVRIGDAQDIAGRASRLDNASTAVA